MQNKIVEIHICPLQNNIYIIYGNLHEYYQTFLYVSSDWSATEVIQVIHHDIDAAVMISLLITSNKGEQNTCWRQVWGFPCKS